MSIASELSALNGHIISAYDEINTMGGTVPANKNMANLPTAIASIPSGGGGSATIGTYNVISGTATVSSDATTISVLSYNDFMTAVGGTMPAKVGLGVFDIDVVYNMPAGFAFKFGFKGANSTPHYGNGSDIKRGYMNTAVQITEAGGVSTYADSSGGFKTGRTYVWFILWK